MAKEGLSEFEKDKVMDIFNLHLMFKNQSDLYGKWSSRKATASKDKFLAEERLKALRASTKRRLAEAYAKLDLDIRSNWDMYDFDKKPTETATKSWVEEHNDYKKVQDDVVEEIHDAVVEVAEAIENLEYLEGAVMAMTHRKASIEGEITLWMGGYFSDPKIPKTLTKEGQKIVQKKLRRTLKKED